MGTQERRRRADQRSAEPEAAADRQAIAEAACAELWQLSHAVRPVDRAFLEGRVAVRVEPLRADERRAVQDLLDLWLRNELGRALDRSWDVGDLHHHIGRQLGDRHRELQLRLLRGVITDRVAPDRSRLLAEVDALLREQGPVPSRPEADVLATLAGTEPDGQIAWWAVSCELLRLLFRLPDLPRLDLSPPDIADAPGTDRKLLDRVRGLLSKAESTTFPDEAEALTAKAQELMARHAIDQAMVDRARGRGRGDASGPTSLRVWIDNPYADGKSLLLNNVATANRCRAVFYRSLGLVTAVGFPADLDAVDLLFTSLLVQADTAVREAGPQVDRSGRSRTRSFRASFWVAFASRIGQRLAEAVAASVHEAEAEHGASLHPVLASRDAAVQAHLDELFPDAVGRGVVASNAAGWSAGTEAADRADLGVRRPIRAPT
jgi:hypothetical protein